MNIHLPLLCVTIANCTDTKMYRMSRRHDSRTAELVDIALLTRAAFEQMMAERYAQIAGIPRTLIHEVFARPFGQLRNAGAVGYLGVNGDRRMHARA